MLRKCFIPTVLLAFCACVGPARAATTVAIANAGFESPAVSSSLAGVHGWIGAGGGVGVWNINLATSSPVCAPCWTAAAPEGNQIAYLSAAPLPGASASISQTLGETLQPGTRYTLGGWVGHPIHHGGTAGPPTVFTVALLAGGNTLASLSGTGPEGAFGPFQMAFDSAGSPWLGQPLAIKLSSSQPQTGFDGIWLEASAVPLPPALWLFVSALTGLGLAGRRGGPA